MRRRDFVKTIVAASVSAASAVGQQKPATPVAPPPKPLPAPGPVPWSRGLMGIKPLPVGRLTPDALAETETHFLSETQVATLRRLCELFQPAYKHYPGAIEAGAPEFLDFLIGVSPQEGQQMYLSGLDRLASEAQRRFAKSFAALDADQADQIIRPALRPWINEHPPTEPFERFIAIVHVDIRTATVNSQVWADAAKRAGEGTPNVDLYWYPIDPDMRRDASSGAHSDLIS